MCFLSTTFPNAPAHPPPPYFLTSPLSNTTVVAFFQIFVYRDVVYAQTWELLAPKKLYQATLMRCFPDRQTKKRNHQNQL